MSNLLLPNISGGTKCSPLKQFSTCSIVQPFEENLSLVSVVCDILLGCQSWGCPDNEFWNDQMYPL